MDLELFIIVALIIVFMVSCCGLIQKIRHSESQRGLGNTVAHIQMANAAYGNTNPAYGGDDLMYNGVYPDTLAPPPYLDHLEPPPKYEDLIKENHPAFVFTTVVDHSSGTVPIVQMITIPETHSVTYNISENTNTSNTSTNRV